jgi:hypothetical protein
MPVGRVNGHALERRFDFDFSEQRATTEFACEFDRIIE